MSVRVLQGHTVDVQVDLPVEHFHVAVCSPPYWQLRKYGTPPQTWADGWVGELGWEPGPEQYCAHLVEVFAATRRVLRDDGTLWVNIADTWFTNPGGQNGRTMPPLGASSQLHKKQHEGIAISGKAMASNAQVGRVVRTKVKHPYLREGDQVGIPAMFRRAMLEDGWRRAAELTLIKTSPMPASVAGWRWERCRVKVRDSTSAVTHYQANAYGESPQGMTRAGGVDGRAEWAPCPGCEKCEPNDGLVLRRGAWRPTAATEKFYVFSKTSRYFIDQEAVRVPLAPASMQDGRTARGARGTQGEYGAADGNCGFDPAGRNLWDWVTWRPDPYIGEHYASYPSAIPALAIQAGTSERGCCPMCGAPWARVVEWTPMVIRRSDWGEDAGNRTASSGTMEPAPSSRTLGWRQTCRCPAHEPVPCRVLDPFGGSGTSGVAANRNGCDATLVELKPEYVALATQRLDREPLSLFAQEGAAAG